MRTGIAKQIFLAGKGIGGFLFLTACLSVVIPFNPAWGDDPSPVTSDQQFHSGQLYDYMRKETLGWSSNLPDTLRSPVGWAANGFHVSESSLGFDMQPVYSNGFGARGQMRLDDNLTLNTSMREDNADNSFILRWKLNGN
jgi:hypothetical protein